MWPLSPKEARKEFLVELLGELSCQLKQYLAIVHFGELKRSHSFLRVSHSEAYSMPFEGSRQGWSGEDGKEKLVSTLCSHLDNTFNQGQRTPRGEVLRCRGVLPQIQPQSF